jgi:hypothetical protein
MLCFIKFEQPLSLFSLHNGVWKPLVALDFASISCSDLDQRLGKFYAEAAPNSNQSRAKQMAAEQANEYTKNSFKSIRSAINRHCQDLGRDIDIVRGKEFRVSNNILDGKLKKNLQEY